MIDLNDYLKRYKIILGKTDLDDKEFLKEYSYNFISWLKTYLYL